MATRQAVGRKSRSGGTVQRDVGLDFVRGLAVLAVVDYHNNLFLPLVLSHLGYVNFEGGAAVTTFFVLSGFLVGGLLMREWREHARVDGVRFLIRRAFKIWPLYYVFILLGIVTGHRSLRASWGNLLNVQNYAGGVAHTWSLAVEEHAYLLLALLLTVAAARGMRKRWLAAVLAGSIAIISVARAIAIAHGVPVFAQTHFRMDEILYGVLLAMIFHFKPAWFRRMQGWKWLWTGLFVVALALEWGVERSRPFGWFQQDYMTMLGLAVLMLFSPRTRTTRPNLLVRGIAWIGIYSYGIYLWHVSVIAPVRELVARLHWPDGLVSGILAALAGIVLGIVATRLVELPMLRLRDRLFPKRTHFRLETGTEEVVR